MRSLPASVIAVLVCALAAVVAAQDSAPAVPLASKDRQFLDKHLGRGVIGEALPAQAFDIGASSARIAPVHAVRRVVYGKNKGKDIDATLELLRRPDGSEVFRLDTGGKTVLYGQIEPDGTMDAYASDDRKEGVITQYDPPVPIYRPGMRAGVPIVIDTKVNVFDLSNPGKRKHRGRMRVTLDYLGNFRVNVPAGSFEAMGLRWTYKGKVGPADVEDISYWFVDEEAGPVAWVNRLNVSAFLLYNDHSRRASVLARIKQTGTP